MPGETPHPDRDPEGHQYGKEESQITPLDPADWKGNNEYLYGVDLYNFAYFWEAHEAWEGLWQMTRPGSPDDKFLQGLIQVSAALLKREQGVSSGAESLSRKGLSKLALVGENQAFYCGINLPDFIFRMEKIFATSRQDNRWPEDPRLILDMTSS